MIGDGGDAAERMRIFIKSLMWKSHCGVVRFFGGDAAAESDGGD